MSRRRPGTEEHAKAHELLRSQPHHAVVIDGSGHAWQEGGLSLSGLWYRAYGDGKPLSSHELAFQYPITVMEKGKTS